MRNPKGNISILVIFILLAAWLIWTLTMIFVKQIMNSYDSTLSYYKSYYLAKAWSELALSEITNRWIGFENVVSAWDKILLQNFFCKWWCKFAMSISGTSQYLSKNFIDDADCQNPFVLNTWSALILPLFKEVPEKNNYDIFTSPIKYQNMSDVLSNIIFTWINIANPNVSIWILIVAWDKEIYTNWIFIQTWILNNNLIWKFKSDFENYSSNDTKINSRYTNDDYINEDWLKNYLLISNLDNANPISFCINVKNWEKIATEKFWVKSIWKYSKTNIWLEVEYKQPIPDFLANSYLNF
jgi:hypothetical protein